MKGLTHRLSALEAKAGEPGGSVYLFQLPGEDAEAALACTFGTAPEVTVTLFSGLPVQGLPE